MVSIVSAISATPQYDLVTTYYDGPDLATANVVGRKFEMCSGTWRTGTTSAYYDYWIGESCDGGCIADECGTEYADYGNCNDDVDNDGDGYKDMSDPGCYMPGGF